MTTATTGATAAPSATTTAQTTLTGNYTDFLKLLMTQLKNQDPTAPLDTNQFTSQLVQYSSVEQQINTNTNLTQLIQATQSGTLLQSSSLVGQTVNLTGNQLSLQNGTAGVDFTTTGAQPVNVTITTPAGVTVSRNTVQSAPGSNHFTWNGLSSNGTQLPDGVYNVTVAGTDGSTVPFTVRAMATGIERSGNVITVDLGSLRTDLSTVQSLATR